jgi:hypothetical protein
MNRLLIAAAFAIFALVSEATATPITYAVGIGLPIGVPDPTVGGQLTGTITTDGTIGYLAISDITSWNLTLTVGSHSAELDPTNSNVGEGPLSPPCSPCTPAPISATATALVFNFFSEAGSPSDPPLLRFQG